MKLLSCFLFLSIVLLSFSVEASSKNSCSNITCSGFGKCVIRSGVPVCICRKGYYPDAGGGLKCIYGKIDPENKALIESRVLWENELLELHEIENALNSGHVKKNYVRFKKKNPTESYAEYIIARYEKSRRKSALLLVAGPLFFGGGVVLTTWAFMNIPSGSIRNTSMGIMVPAFVVLTYALGFGACIIGTGFIVFGAFKVHQYNDKIKKLRPIAARYSPDEKLQTSKKVKFEGVSPVISPVTSSMSSDNKIYIGATIRFSFI